jgi:putative endonuclease
VSERTAAQRLGDTAEVYVARRLSAAGWTVIARNVRLGHDEIDLVALDPGPPTELVAVEVRWRVSRAFGLPEETVGWAKRRALRRALGTLRGRLPDLAPELIHLPLRLDLVAVEPPRADGPPILRHHRAVEFG